MIQAISKRSLSKKMATQKVLNQLYREFLGYMARHLKTPGEEELRSQGKAPRLKAGSLKSTKPCGFKPPSNDPMARVQDMHDISRAISDIVWQPAAHSYILNTIRELTRKHTRDTKILLSRDDLLELFAYRKFSEGLADSSGITDIQGKIAEAATVEALLASNVFKKPKTLIIGGDEIIFWRL